MNTLPYATNTLRLCQKISHTTSTEELQKVVGVVVRVRLGLVVVGRWKASPKIPQNIVEQFLWIFIVYGVG